MLAQFAILNNTVYKYTQCIQTGATDEADEAGESYPEGKTL